eukprot:jgi/Galph1/4392/GphlegSOOS_G3102.1
MNCPSLLSVCLDVIVAKWEGIPKEPVKLLPSDLLTKLLKVFVEEGNLSLQVIQCLELVELDTLELAALAGRVGDDWLRVLSTMSIRHISLSSCSRITDEGLHQLAPCLEDVPNHCSLIASLRSIDLSGCSQISNAGMESLTRFKLLETLILDNCVSLGNMALLHISNCQHIRHLSLINCDKISGSGLEYIFFCSNLEYLDLSGCTRVTSDALTGISKLKHLRHLKLRNCYKIDNRALIHISKLRNLCTLELYDCAKLDTAGLQYLHFCISLSHLCLTGTCIDAEGLQYLSASFLPQLESVHLTRCAYLSSKQLSIDLRKLSKTMRKLQLRNVDCVDDKVLEAISETFPLLESLNLTDCRRVTDDAIIHLNKLTHLRVLKLRSTCISGKGLESITKILCYLSQLDIASCPFLTDSSIQRVLEKSVALEFLDISRNAQLTDWNWSGNSTLHSRLVHLKTLFVEHCPHLANNFIIQIGNICPTLETLFLSGCSFDSTVLPIVASFGYLKHLKLSFCNSLKSCKYLLPLHQSLRHLNISNCQWVTDGCCHYIGLLKNLKTLSLKNCSMVSSQGLNALRKLSHLSYLNVRGCQVVEEAIWPLQRYLPNIHILKFDMARNNGFQPISIDIQQSVDQSCLSLAPFRTCQHADSYLQKEKRVSHFIRKEGNVNTKENSLTREMTDLSISSTSPSPSGSSHRRRRRRIKSQDDRISQMASPTGIMQDYYSKFSLYMDSLQLFENFVNTF